MGACVCVCVCACVCVHVCVFSSFWERMIAWKRNSSSAWEPTSWLHWQMMSTQPFCSQSGEGSANLYKWISRRQNAYHPIFSPWPCLSKCVKHTCAQHPIFFCFLLCCNFTCFVGCCGLKTTSANFCWDRMTRKKLTVVVVFEISPLQAILLTVCVVRTCECGSLFRLCLGSLLCNGLCAPIWKNSTTEYITIISQFHICTHQPQICIAFFP